MADPKPAQPEPGPQEPDTADDAPADGEAAATRRLPPFSPRRFVLELMRDAAIRWALLALALVALLALAAGVTGSSLVSLVAAVLAIGLWLFISTRNAMVTRALPEVNALIEADPDVAEGALAQLIERKPLLRWVRLMLYHRLAMLRHRQERFGEAGAICQSVLDQPMGPAHQARAHLLLMLAEARLECNDPVGAYHALTQLYATRLSLIEAQQRLGLQIRYEVMVGHNAAALRALAQKIQLIEIMPAPQCGSLHALLAVAATRAGREDTAAWLWKRAQLLCVPDQLDHFKQMLDPQS